MEIRHDRSYIPANDLVAIERGFAKLDVFSLRFDFEYTEKEKQENLAFAQACPEQWAARCNTEALRRSEELKPVMEAIAEQFVCYQYDPHQSIAYASPEWDLFFWCRDLHTITNGAMSGRDYSYFTLNFNDYKSREERIKICDDALAFALKEFSHMEHLRVIVQYGCAWDDEKAKKFLAEKGEKLIGCKCIHNGKSGKIFRRGNFLVFKRGKQYSRLTDRELLQILWENEQGREAC